MVNVVDVQGDEIPVPTKEKDMLALMFERQHSLATKYLDIEAKNGLLQTPDLPVNLDDRKGQARLKDFAWRTMEELFEATDALVAHPDNLEHFLEEMIDSVHFFIELNLLCGITPQSIREYFSIPEDQDALEFLLKVMDSIETYSREELQAIPVSLLIYVGVGQGIGNAMNRLKNKPWKQSHMVTDKAAFYQNLYPVWLGYLRVLNHKYGLSPHDIFTLYFKKSEVNKFRIKSQY